MRVSQVLSISALTILASACGDDSHTSAPRTPPAIGNLAVAGNSNNVLSAIATQTVTDADSARVVYWSGSGAKVSTPFTTDLSSGRILVLGLRPSTAYDFAVEAIGSGGTATSDTVTFTTDSLPTFLASASISSPAPSSGGYILTALNNGSTGYATAFDSAGRVAWYRAFPGGMPAVEVKQQTNGAITAMLSTSHGGDLVAGQVVAVSPEGVSVRTYTAPASSYLDPHEFWELTDDQGAYAGAVFFAYTVRHVDLSAHGGSSDSLITGHQLVVQSAAGVQTVLFDAWDHFVPTDNVELVAGQVDFDHPNSLSIAADGNYVVSWRNLDVITKIDASTGALIWTLAGPFSARASDFTFVSDPLNGFSAQHSARALDNGNLLVFDNGTRHPTPTSRAVEYQLDTSAHTATLAWQYQHAPPIYTAFTGSTQRLVNGNTLIGWTFGNPLLATEVTSAGSTVWEGTLHAAGTQVPYRFTKIRSLYAYAPP
jgi:hypothetical protein